MSDTYRSGGKIHTKRKKNQQNLRAGGKKKSSNRSEKAEESHKRKTSAEYLEKQPAATSGGGIKEFGKDLKRSADRLNSNLKTTRKYVVEDVKRRVTGKPTQREEREASDAKVKKLKKTKDATELKRGGKYIKPKTKSAGEKGMGSGKGK